MPTGILNKFPIVYPQLTRRCLSHDIRQQEIQPARLSTDLLQPGTPLSSIYPRRSRSGRLVLDSDALEVQNCEPAESAEGRVSGDIHCFHTLLKISTLHFAFVFVVVLSLPSCTAQFSNQPSEARTACFAKSCASKKDTDPLETAGEAYQG